LASLQVTGADKFVDRLLQKTSPVTTAASCFALTYYAGQSASYMKLMHVGQIGVQVNISEIQFQHGGFLFTQVSKPVTHLDYFEPYTTALLQITYNQQNYLGYIFMSNNLQDKVMKIISTVACSTSYIPLGSKIRSS
jgi:hypothetical protein